MVIDGQSQTRRRLGLRHRDVPLHRLAAHHALLFGDDQTCQRAAADFCFRKYLHWRGSGWNGTVSAACDCLNDHRDAMTERGARRYGTGSGSDRIQALTVCC